MNKRQRLLLALGSVLLIIIRVMVHTHFTGVYTDGDQTITWLSAVDKSNGLWYTPFFYGQFYNISMEAICSAPFIALGGSVELVVPIVSNVLGVLPFFLGALFLVRIKQFNAALFILTLGIILPAQYHFVTAMARGFAGGIAVFSIGLYITGFSGKWIKSIGYALIFIAYLVNPNVLIILAPLAIYWIYDKIELKKVWSLSNYLPILIGLIVCASFFLWIQTFNRPHYEVHKLWRLGIELDYLVDSFKSLDARFLYLFPFLPKMGSLLFITCVIAVGWFIYKRNWKATIIMGLTVAFVVTTLAVNKTLDGTYSTFFPYSRMYLALPYLLIMVLTLFKPNPRAILGLIAVLTLGGFIYQMFDIPKKAIESVRGNTGVVQVLTIDKLCLECETFERLTKEYDADLLVFHYKTDEYIYGCKALKPNLPTLYPEYDRRYWEFSNHADTAYESILFMDWSLQLPSKLTNYKGKFGSIDSIPYPAYLMTNNTESIIELYSNNNLHLRPYPK
jgi:hypothetical protein